METTALQNLLNEWDQAVVWVEALVLLACLALAWGVARFMGQRTGGRPDLAGEPAKYESVWFGQHTIDGLLFPLLALLLIYGARYGMALHQPVLLLRVALPIFVSLAVIRLCVRVLRASFPQSASIKFIEQSVSWLAWVGAVLWITGFLPVVQAEMEDITFAFGQTRVSLRTLFEGAVSSALMLVVVLWISATLEKRILRGGVGDLSMRKIAANAIRAGLLFIGLLFVLSAVGVDLTALSVLGGALGVGLGFGLQKLAANYVSGFVILLERSLRIGDMVRVDGFEGVVTDIKTRYTLIRALNGRESVVPNELFITQRVENLSPEPFVWLSIKITVGYDSDPAQVMQFLVDAASAQPRVRQAPSPVAMLDNFGADGLEFTLAFAIDDPEVGHGGLRSDINLRVLQALREAKIDIPYPQRVVHWAEESPPQANRTTGKDKSSV
ncbi:mechanosensitive ion channel protein [Hylemonella gracilis str. Niagara R]|uniref:Mechanosensitive ion channel protein n=1 Tax=Hylemonella gracilis str. Niagara R TaxID=1458275 RepID=A0A016XJF7_9BURK|nr:mechanosensitive ion channel domain-containing protein [Hylemonella gracilis]EYC52015.1 mechanosensitive ion channel protein [Hylemonella gracilis str. Niagara R]